METIFEILLDALADTVKALPFLFGAYLIIEYLEHHSSDRIRRALAGSQRLGPAAGAVLGCIPQCGFSVAAANLYGGRVITAGTLIAVFLSTSDEAVPILLANPGMLDTLGRLLLVKAAVAVLAGMAVDVVARRAQERGQRLPEEKREPCLCSHRDCRHSIFWSAAGHTAEIFFFLLAVSAILGGIVEAVGAETMSRFLLKGSILQPAAAALIGFIPHCAASVFLAQMLADGTISFGAAAAGLLTGAGAGMAVLWKVNPNRRDNLKLMAILYGVAVVAGTVLQLTVG